MRAYSWILLSGLTLACGGAAFTGISDDGGGGDNGGAADGGAGATDSGGSAGSKAGQTSSAGTTLGGRATTEGGSAGASITGGAPPIAGQPGVAGGATEPPPDTSCPTSPPTEGGACEDGLLCSYGRDVRLDCRPRATCDNGHWTLFDPDCKELSACSNDVSAGNACDMDAAICVKDETQYCRCASCVGMVCGTEPTWHCAGGAGSSGCPKLAPNQGQPCQGERTCQYGSCDLGQASPAEATCDGHTWSYDTIVCPL